MIPRSGAAQEVPVNHAFLSVCNIGAGELRLNLLA